MSLKFVGSLVGLCEGLIEGIGLGEWVGFRLGKLVGSVVGIMLGDIEIHSPHVNVIATDVVFSNASFAYTSQ